MNQGKLITKTLTDLLKQIELYQTQLDLGHIDRATFNVILSYNNVLSLFKGLYNDNKKELERELENE